ncbi:MAG: class I SAM-dependent methyltransferase [Anaerolineae bacterium]|nr:class I SAM-dependent methyltransferase [Anaerolineae bacterium]
MNLDEYARMYAAEDKHWWYVGMRETTLGLLNGHLQPRGSTLPKVSEPSGGYEETRRPRILDAGCGTGGLLARLSEEGWAVGVDLSATALGWAQRRTLPNLGLASVESLPFRDGVFDLVTCIDVLYHLQVHEDMTALREFRRVLRPGGYLLVKVPAFEALRGQHDKTVHTHHRYRLSEMCAKLQASGFRVERATYANTLLLPAAATKRFLENVFPLAAEGTSDVQMPPAWLNTILTHILLLEARLVREVNLPVGVSAIALAQRIPE